MNNPSIKAVSSDVIQPSSSPNVQVMTTFDLTAVTNRAGFNKSSRKLLDRAINKYGWQPTSISSDGDIINMMSEDGRACAQLVISKGHWHRIDG